MRALLGPQRTKWWWWQALNRGEHSGSGSRLAHRLIKYTGVQMNQVITQPPFHAQQSPPLPVAYDQDMQASVGAPKPESLRARLSMMHLCAVQRVPCYLEVLVAKQQKMVTNNEVQI